MRGVRFTNGRWQARYSVTSTTGESRQVSLYGKTQSEVEHKLVEALAQKQKGMEPTRGRATVAGYLAEWIAERKLTMARAQTWIRYEQLLRVHIVPGLGRHRLSELRAVTLSKHYQELIAAGNNPSTVHHAHRVFRAALADAVEKKLLHANPASDLGWPRPHAPEMRTLDVDQVARLLEHSRPRDRVLFLTAVSTGMRSGELLGLAWSNVELEGAEPHLAVLRTLLDVRGRQPVLGEPKTSRSRRRIELSRDLVDELRAHRVLLLEERIRLANAWEAHDLVFPSTRGTPRRRANVTRDLHAALEAAGLPRIRFHDLRHTAATLLLGRVNPKSVADMLGHSDVAITLNLYSHSSRTSHREAAETMADVLRGR